MRLFTLLFAILWYQSFDVSAKPASQGYLDSVKGFFRDFEDNKPQYRNRINLENAIFLFNKLDSDILIMSDPRSMLAEVLNEPIVRVFKYEQNGGRFNYEKKLDSIEFTRNEVVKALSIMHDPSIPNWTTAILQSDKIWSQKRLDSLYKPYSDLLSEYEAKFNRRDSDPNKVFNEVLITAQIENAKTDCLIGDGYWKFCNPIFLQKGGYALIYYHRFSLPMKVKIFLAVYKFENGHWQHFSNLIDISLN